MEEVKRFGYILRKIRIERGLTQTKFAEMLGTSKQVVSRYENNQRCPKVTTAAEFAKRLGVPLAHLVYGDIPYKHPVAENLEKAYSGNEANRLLHEEADGLSKEEMCLAIAFIREIKDSRVNT